MFSRRKHSKERVSVLSRSSSSLSLVDCLLARNTISKGDCNMAAVGLKYLLLLKSRMLLAILLLRRRQRPGSIWIRDIYEAREEKGEHHLLVKKLRLHDAEYFFKCFRMVPAVFQEHLNWVGRHLQKNDRQMREAISSSERSPVCLRYLAFIRYPSTSCSKQAHRERARALGL